MPRTAIVTGGAGGLGQAICERLLRDGFIVYCCDLHELEGLRVIDKLSHLGTIEFFKLDVSCETDWIALYNTITAKFGTVDVLVNNAGINIRVEIEKCSVEDWDKMFAVNVRGVFLGIKHSLPIMRTQKSGSIINISSVCGLIGHLYTNESYTATKGAVTLLTKSVASRYGKYNIRCNSIHPSTIDTEIVKQLFTDPVKRQERIDEVPMGHLGLPSDVANAVGYLASKDAQFINGVQLPVDGGTTCY